MSVSKADILQIRRYLNGELDARAMYELELRAQNNAELMDVMQGMEAAQTDHQPHIDELNDLIAHRVVKKEKRIVPMYRTWAAAASVLLLLGIGGWWLSSEAPKAKLAEDVALTAPTDKVKTDTVPTIAKIPKPVDDRPQIKSADVAVLKKPAAKANVLTPAEILADLAPAPNARQNHALAADLIESVKMDSTGHVAKNGLGAIDKNNALAYNTNPAAQQKAAPQIFGSVNAKKQGASYTVTKEVEDHPIANVEQLLQGKLAGIEVRPDGAIKTRASAAVKRTNIAKDSAGYRTVNGIITDSKTGELLVGATINMPGKGLAQADVNGKFSVVVPDNITLLNATFIGYKTAQINIGDNADLKIALVPDERSLNETVIRGYVKRSKPADQPYTPAPGCDENMTFRATFLSNIALIEKHVTQHLNKQAMSVTDKQASEALQFIARYATVSINTTVKNGITYPELVVFTAERNNWLSWYDANKCKNLQ